MTNFNTPYKLKNKRVWVAGHRGMVGSALVRRLASEDVGEILTTTREDLDLQNQESVNRWMGINKPDVVIVAAAKVGGIHANNTYPAEFIYENIIISSNIIHAAHKVNVEKLLFLGSSCIYPKFAEQPIQETSLLTGPLEATNEWYAIAKIAGIKLCEAYRKQYGCDFISAMPTNLYGPGDNYHPENSHVIPALLRKAHVAKITNAESMEVWGTGTVRREFMHADDCADSLVFVLKNYSEDSHINIGTGQDITIQALATLVAKVVGYGGELKNNISQPDGTPRKLMANDKLSSMGWTSNIALEEGLKQAYAWFVENQDSIRES